MRDHFIKQLEELALNNTDIILVTGDLGFGVLDQFEKKFPNQYINAGVAEQNMTGLAVGLALEGKTVFTYSICNFPTLRCLEQIRNDACYHEANVNIVSIGGGFGYGSLGFSHHATEDLSIMRALPAITVVAPGDNWETMESTKALSQIKGTTYLRLDKATAGMTNKAGEKFQLGKARILKEGSDITLISTGGILDEVLKAHEELKSDGIHARVVSMHTLKPIDADVILDCAENTGGIITVEEHTIQGGLGSIVAEVCMDTMTIPQFFYRVGLKQGFTTVVGSQEYLREHYDINKKIIVSKAKECLKTKPSMKSSA